MPASRAESKDAAKFTRASQMKLSYRAQSHIGLVRSCNEDAYAVGDGQSDEYAGSLFVVCDGMGGQGVGDVAAQLAANTIIEAYYSSENPDRGAALVEAFSAANQRVFQQVGPAADGTTAVAALLVEGKLYIAHVGDSRAYRFHSNCLQQITEDHRYIERLIRLGIITREDPRKHPGRNPLYRSVGARESIEVDLFRELMEEEDMVLLCTDGLHGFVESTEIENELRTCPFANGVGRLIDLANTRGGCDNATAILIWRDE